MKFIDRLTLDGIRRTADGYVVAEVKAARTGVQVYKGSEVGRPDLATVRVYRPPEEVFSTDSLRSFAYRPVTLGHVKEVNAGNWKDVARGFTGGEVARDGDFVRVPLVLMDAVAIDAVERGTDEVSMGYEAAIEFKDGVSPQGEQYDATQRQQRMNHLAIVSTARGGSQLRIGDEEEPTMANKTVMLDGLSIETTEQGAQAIDKLQRDLKRVTDQAVVDLTARDAIVTDLKAQIAKKDGEMAVLKKAVEDGAMTPVKLDAAVIARTQLVSDARAILGDAIDVKGKTDIEIRRAVVTDALGEATAKPMSDAVIEGAFAALVAKMGDSDGDRQRQQSSLTPLRSALGDSVSLKSDTEKADKAYSDYVIGLQDGWKNPQPEARQ